jgi:hypothetical protein
MKIASTKKEKQSSASQETCIMALLRKNVY